MEVVIRIAIVAVVGVLLLTVVDAWQGRRQIAVTRLPAGVALVVTPTCRLCETLHRKLSALGVAYQTVQADDARLGSLVVRTAPALMCVGKGGEVQTIRTGRAAIARMHDVLGCLATVDERAKT